MAKGREKKRAFISSWRGDSQAFRLSRVRERRKSVDNIERAPISKIGRGVSWPWAKTPKPKPPKRREGFPTTPCKKAFDL